MAVGYFEQNIGVARLIERTPTGEVFSTKGQLDICWRVSKIPVLDILSVGGDTFSDGSWPRPDTLTGFHGDDRMILR